MRYTELGRTGLKVSQATIGTWAIGGTGWGEVHQADCVRAIETMLDQGVNLIDTAPFYGLGESERIIGKTIRNCRDQVYLLSKAGTGWDENGVPCKRSDYRSIIEDCESSLKRLGTDYIDLYLIHWPDEVTPMEEMMRAMNQLKKDGKIRFIGASNFSKEEVLEAQQYAQFDVLQQPYSMVAQQFREELTWAHEQGIGTMSYGSLGAGILTGSIRELPQFTEDDMRLNFYDYFREPKFSRVMELVKRLDTYAEKYQVPVSQVTINWNTQSGFLDTILMGVRNQAEAKENCAAFAWSMEQEDVDCITRDIEEILGEA